MTTTVTPTGPISLAQHHLAASLAASAAFQAMVGAANAAEALERIYLFAGPPARRDRYSLDELSYVRPFGMVWTEEDDGFGFEILAFPTTFSRSGLLGIRFERELPAAWEGKPSDADMDWLNTLGAIFEDLINLSATGGYLALRRGQSFKYNRTHPDRKTGEGVSQYAEISIAYSEGGAT